MRLLFAKPFRKEYAILPSVICRSAEEKLKLLLEDFRHPSLRAKKMEGYLGIWEGRITKNYRFTFQVTKDAYIIRHIGTHNILRRP